jgi:hypothetical protein
MPDQKLKRPIDDSTAEPQSQEQDLIHKLLSLGPLGQAVLQQLGRADTGQSYQSQGITYPPMRDAFKRIMGGHGNYDPTQTSINPIKSIDELAFMKRPRSIFSGTDIDLDNPMSAQELINRKMIDPIKLMSMQPRHGAVNVKHPPRMIIPTNRPWPYPPGE